MKFQSVSQRFDPIPVRLSQSSKTVPDMSFTPREIISKFSRGEKVPLGFNSLYDSEESEDDPVFRGHDPSVFEDDPTRDPAFDFGDYVEAKRELDEREAERRSKRELDEREAERRSKRARAGKDKSPGGSKRKASAEESSASEAMKRETTSGETQERPSSASKAE